MAFQVDLITAIAELLHAENVGLWSPAGTYGANDTAITIDQLPTSPDKSIALTLYTVQDDGTTDSIMGLQARCRGGRGERVSLKDIEDRLFDALHDLQAVTLGGIPIVRVWRQSGTGLGTDGNNRQESSSNYYIQLTRLGAHRRD